MGRASGESAGGHEGQTTSPQGPAQAKNQIFSCGARDLNQGPTGHSIVFDGLRAQARRRRTTEAHYKTKNTAAAADDGPLRDVLRVLVSYGHAVAMASTTAGGDVALGAAAAAAAAAARVGAERAAAVGACFRC